MVFSFLYGLAIAALAVAAGAIYRGRLAATRPDAEPRLTDDMVRRIEEQGRIEVEEPLDLDAIREEEERFWGESWDEPDEW